MLEFAPFAAQAATEQHWAAFAVNYRLDENDKAAWPDELHDVQAAIRFIVSQASTYGIDTANVLLMGDSAGANLAALVSEVGTANPITGPRSGRTRPPTSRSSPSRCGRPRSTWPTWWATPVRRRPSAARTRRATSSGPLPTSSTTSGASRLRVPGPMPMPHRSPGCRPRRCGPTSPTRPTS